jgi:NAD(P)H-hydrate repair Nnr-like enzyme with NAD(P)H-hydrate epimerase domain
VNAARFSDDVAWSAAVDVDGTTVLVRAEGESWAILAPSGADSGDAMAAARRLHALLGTKTSDWDQDR